MIVSSTAKRGYDAWTDSGAPHVPHGSTSAIQLQGTSKYGWVWLPIDRNILGNTVTTATLTAHAHGTVAAQTLTVVPVSLGWQAGTITDSNKPGTRAGSATVVLGTSLADGAEISWDVKTLVQQVANGSFHLGWRISTSLSTLQKLASFDSGDLSWTLTYEYAEKPEAPTTLAPNGTIVGAGKPVVTFNFTEYGATAGDLSAVRVEVDTNLDGTVDWDSGWLAATDPSLDLAAVGMTGTISSGQSVNWRAYTRDSNGDSSDASDWATYTYKPLPGFVLDSPAAGVLYDPTSDVLAHITGTGQTLAAYQVWVTDGDDRSSVRYNSKKQKATSSTNIAWTLPLRNNDGSRIFTDDHAYQIHVRAWTTDDRQATPGVAAHVDLWTTVVFNDDLSPKVTTFQATQVDETPFVQLTWTDAAAADAYLISRDGVHIARLLPADTVAGVSTYTWVDITAAPAVQHVYQVRRITVGVGRSAPRQDAITIYPEGIWLLRPNGDSVVLDDTGVDQLTQPERWLIYNPINIPGEVGILTQYDGITGPVTASIEDAEDQSVDDARAVLDAIKRHPTEDVQLIYGTVSKPVRVKNMSVDVDTEYREDMNRHRVTFTVSQSGDFDFRVG